MLNNDANAPAKRVGLLGKLRSWFFTGLLVTAPVLLTVYITWAAINLIDGQVASLVPGFSELRFANVPGVGLVIGVVLITVIGAVAAGFLGRWIIKLGESILNRMPVVRSIYGASKQISETVISTQSDAFREVVLVEIPPGAVGDRLCHRRHEGRGGTADRHRHGQCLRPNDAESDIGLSAVLPARGCDLHGHVRRGCREAGGFGRHRHTARRRQIIRQGENGRGENGRAKKARLPNVPPARSARSRPPARRRRKPPKSQAAGHPPKRQADPAFGSIPTPGTSRRCRVRTG